MEKKVLANGLTVIFSRTPTQTVTLLINVFVGSNSEDKKVKGISHFVEHLLFEGTEKRKDSMEISNEIEKLGGELNAATANSRTFYYTKVLNKHFPVALDVMSDIVQNSRFDDESIEHERKIITDEINLIVDQPRYYQWVFFQNCLFKEHPAKYPIYGFKETVQLITRKDILDYYKKHYTPENMNVVIVGNPEGDPIAAVESAFSSFKGSKKNSSSILSEPDQKANVVAKETRAMNQSYMILGFKTMPKAHPDSSAMEVVRAHLGRGQSGRLFYEVRTRLGLAYEVGVFHNPNTDFGFLAFYAGTDKKNISKVEKAILSEIKKMRTLSDKELEEAKTFIEGEFELSLENTQNFADNIAFWEQCECPGDVKDFIVSIRAVTKEDVRRVIDKYLSGCYTLSVIEQEK